MFSGQNKHSERGSWGEIPRACATVFLAIYFTGLGLTVACNTSSGSSLLLSVVKGKLFSFWLVPPWLDLGFDYSFAYGQQADAAHYLELREYGKENWIKPSYGTMEIIHNRSVGNDCCVRLLPVKKRLVEKVSCQQVFQKQHSHYVTVMILFYGFLFSLDLSDNCL